MLRESTRGSHLGLQSLVSDRILEIDANLSLKLYPNFAELPDNDFPYPALPKIFVHVNSTLKLID